MGYHGTCHLSLRINTRLKACVYTENTSDASLRNFSTSGNHYEHFRSRPEIFPRFPNTSEDFLKILKNHKNIWKLLLNRFRSFPKIYGDFQALPKLSISFPKIKAWDKVVMQCFLVGYRGTCHLSLVFSSHTHSPKGLCVYGEYKWLVPYSTVYHSKTLHN